MSEVINIESFEVTKGGKSGDLLSEIQVMWSMQDSSHRPNTSQWRSYGVIEGWHGDGNFARTTIMYCLWKTQGVTAYCPYPKPHLDRIIQK